VLYGPTSFAEADTIPDDLFKEELDWDRETGDEKSYWLRLTWDEWYASLSKLEARVD
jgi:hypothetical protein